MLINNPARLKGVWVIEVDERVWSHTFEGPRSAVVITDLTPVTDKTGPTRLLSMVEDRPKKAFKFQLAKQTPEFCKNVKVTSMGRFIGFKTAIGEELLQATTAINPLYDGARAKPAPRRCCWRRRTATAPTCRRYYSTSRKEALVEGALDKCRQRTQRETLGRYGHGGDPLYGVRRTLKTGANLLTRKQVEKFQAILADDLHTCVEAARISHQDVMHTYRQKNRQYGKHLMQQVIDKLANTPKGITARLPELGRLGRTLKRCAGDALVYFDHPHSSNEPTEAISVRLGHLRGATLGLRSLIHYRTRALPETGGFREQLHPQI